MCLFDAIHCYGKHPLNTDLRRMKRCICVRCAVIHLWWLHSSEVAIGEKKYQKCFVKSPPIWKSNRFFDIVVAFFHLLTAHTHTHKTRTPITTTSKWTLRWTFSLLYSLFLPIEYWMFCSFSCVYFFFFCLSLCSWNSIMCLQMFSMRFDGASSQRSKSQNAMTETKTKLDDGLKMFRWNEWNAFGWILSTRDTVR